MRKTNYRGIASAVRRGVNTGELKGLISFGSVRNLLPEEKADAPNKVIEKSLVNLVKNQEIIRKGREFYTKDVAEKEAEEKATVMVTGKLLNSTVRNGKMIVTIEALSIDNS